MNNLRVAKIGSAPILNRSPPFEIKIIYTPETGDTVTLTKQDVPKSNPYDVEEFIDVTAGETGSSTVFKLGVKYKLIRVSVGEDSREGDDTEAFIPMLPTLNLTYTPSSLYTFTLNAEKPATGVQKTATERSSS
ncbi:hypothetical protein BLNAU_11682 [Blattamonas nauphoetae]|uniref:Uncharacterized protein n=1 Tax=Blattamonas nauphoetae TaxID=2049346 RepID=A0ABQ9XS61_9EUKA|nr:hypothetical protein BLNAU_11682 [Blattamonas nauphoetae]